MILSNIAYRFWLPSKEEIIYPDLVGISVDENGNFGFLVNNQDIEEIDKDYVPMLKSPYVVPSGEIYEGDIILYYGREKNVYVKKDTSYGNNLDPEDIAVDFFIQLSEDEEIDLGEIDLGKANVEIVGDIYNGSWYESEFSKEVDRIRQEKALQKEEMRKKRKSQEESENEDNDTSDDDSMYNSVTSRISNSTEEPQEYDEESDEQSDEDSFAESYDFDSEVEESEEDTEDDDEEGEENDTYDSEAQYIDTSNDKPYNPVNVEDILKQSNSNDDDSLELEYEDDSDEDYLWDDEDDELLELAFSKDIQGSEEVFIKSLLDRKNNRGSWAVSIYHFGQTVFDSGLENVADKKLLEMRALEFVLREVQIPSVIRINVDNSFLKKLLSGKEVELKPEYEDLATELLNDSEQHSLIFVNESPYAPKIEAKLAKEMAERRLYE